MSFSGAESDVTRPISPGRSSFSVTQASSTAPLPMALNTMKADYQLRQDPGAPGFLSFVQQFEIEQLIWDVPVTSLQWQFELSHLNRELLESYAQLMQESQQAAGIDPSTASAQLSSLGQEFILGLVRENFSFDNQLELTAFEGDHNLQLNIEWPGIPGISDFQMLDIQELLHTVRITLALDADHAALMSSPFAQTVIDYERPGFLTVGNGRVTSTIQLADGMLDINGEITPLEQFINL